MELPEQTKTRALRILERRDVSRWELIEKLTAKGESPEAAEAVADWLVGLGVVDDVRYAAMVVRHYAAKGYGKSRIRNELFRHGLPKDLWEEAMLQSPEQDETIDRLLRSKLRSSAPDRAELKRATDALLRRGFSWSEIQSAKQRVLADQDNEEFYGMTEGINFED